VASGDSGAHSRRFRTSKSRSRRVHSLISGGNFPGRSSTEGTGCPCAGPIVRTETIAIARIRSRRVQSHLCESVGCEASRPGTCSSADKSDSRCAGHPSSGQSCADEGLFLWRFRFGVGGGRLYPILSGAASRACSDACFRSSRSDVLAAAPKPGSEPGAATRRIQADAGGRFQCIPKCRRLWSELIQRHQSVCVSGASQATPAGSESAVV